MEDEQAGFKRTGGNDIADSHGISYSNALNRKRRAKIKACIVIVDERVKYKGKYKAARNQINSNIIVIIIDESGRKHLTRHDCFH